MLHSRVFPGVEIKIKSLYSTQPHTRACDLAVWHKSVYPIGLAWPNTRSTTLACMATSKGTQAKHKGVWLAV
ncbi:Rhamnogalacturonan exolyase yesX [Gossypium arboreum]|uniref:Rhamnogalacturonan exolyase yesX n=1 Tax=Gossypium arboreum TaxID=29729 RepID=A0A0B0PCL0_GOSAR|nr:Rhamnogalacturonan exolyase yesX [Gossypium arboreum]